MPESESTCGPRPAGDALFAVQYHLLGSVAVEDVLRLQRRLVYDVGGDPHGQIVVLLCEHPAGITIGRAGSRGHLRWTNDQLRQRRLEVRWVNRGGGCVLHGPGQLAIYPIAALRWHGWTVGAYLGRLQQALVATLAELGVRGETFPPSAGVWGRSGLLAACGVAVRNWVTCQGVFVNVNPPMTHYGFVDAIDPAAAVPGQKLTMGSLLAERRQAISAQRLRATLIPQLAAAFGTERYYVVTGHPLLPRATRALHEPRYQAS